MDPVSRQRWAVYPHSGTALALWMVGFHGYMELLGHGWPGFQRCGVEAISDPTVQHELAASSSHRVTLPDRFFG
jgi:hypothetical protein